MSNNIQRKNTQIKNIQYLDFENFFECFIPKIRV